MGKFNEIKNFIAEKVKTKKEAKQTAKMRYLLHLYFDLKGVDMSKDQIKEVNEYLMKNVVISSSSELDNLRRHIYQLSNINGGMEAFKKDRAQVRAKLRDGKIITKTDACIGSDLVIYDDHGIETFHYVERNGQFEKQRSVVRPFNTFAISIDPTASQPIRILTYNDNMKKQIEKFQDVRAVAFPEHTNYSIK